MPTRKYWLQTKKLGIIGRETMDEAVLKPRLRVKLAEFNPDVPEEQIDEAVRHMTKDRSSMHWVRANKEVYDLIRDGVDLQYRNSNGELVDKMLRVIDWNEPGNNDYLLVS